LAGDNKAPADCMPWLAETRGLQKLFLNLREAVDVDA